MANIELGLKANKKQFFLLVLVNAFVGGMVGLERSILPSIAQEDFKLAATTAILSFIIVFGFVKAISNYFAGTLSNQLGRKKILIIGWLFAIPVPFILMWANNWNWIVLANVFLGINQGLAWSSTVIMKIDLVGEKQRGFAMGLNEFSGYVAVALIAYLTGWIADSYGLRPYPFYLGIGLMVLGLFFSIFIIRDTSGHSQMESKTSLVPKMQNVFVETTFLNKNLSSITQAGLVNNLNDGMIWGLLPLFLGAQNFSVKNMAFIAGVYPAMWGICQLFTGRLADKYSKKLILFWGMLLQAIAILFLAQSTNTAALIFLSAILGFGTALVYPTFLAGIADYTHPSQRPASIGIFRLWRDSGYAFGAILSGIVAQIWSIETAISMIGVITLFSAILLVFRMDAPK